MKQYDNILKPRRDSLIVDSPEKLLQRNLITFDNTRQFGEEDDATVAYVIGSNEPAQVGSTPYVTAISNDENVPVLPIQLKVIPKSLELIYPVLDDANKNSLPLAYMLPGTSQVSITEGQKIRIRFIDGLRNEAIIIGAEPNNTALSGQQGGTPQQGGTSPKGAFTNAPPIVQPQGTTNTLKAAPDTYRARKKGVALDRIVIHTMQGSFSGCARWFATPNRRDKNGNSIPTSAHYLVSVKGEVQQMVDDENAAYHAGSKIEPNWNDRSIGIEHEGWVEDPAKWYTDAMLVSSAKLVKQLCIKHSIPIDRTHIIGHAEVPQGKGGHTDPGSGWPWDRYIQLVISSSG